MTGLQDGGQNKCSTDQIANMADQTESSKYQVWMAYSTLYIFSSTQVNAGSFLLA